MFFSFLEVIKNVTQIRLSDRTQVIVSYFIAVSISKVVITFAVTIQDIEMSFFLKKRGNALKNLYIDKVFI